MTPRLVATWAVVLLALFAGTLAILLTRPPAPAGAPDQPAAAASLDGARDVEQPPDSAAAPRPVDAEPAPEPLLPTFCGQPAAVILFTGEQHGYVEPCGCSLNQLGGVSRRADLFRQLRGLNWPVTAFDLGGLVNNPTRRQARLKLGMALKALRDMSYAGIALGVEELRMGIDLLTYEEGQDRPPFVACNLVLFGSPDLGCHHKTLVRKVGETTIGVTAVFGQSLKAEVLLGAEPAEIEILDPVESLRQAEAELSAQGVDLKILLVHARRAEVLELAEAFPGFDIVAGTGGPEDPDPKPKYSGKTLLVWPGQKGKHVAAVGFCPGDPDQRLHFAVVSLDGKRFADTPAMVEHMRHYQELLSLQNLVATEPEIEDPRNATADSTNDFVGAMACGECHRRAYNHWKQTPHARATESIVHGRAGQEAAYISRIHDPECVACHATGWDPKKFIRYRTGFASREQSAHLEGQQCENCHGPGGRHTELERLLARDPAQVAMDEVEAWRERTALAVDQAFDLCARCHDGDNDPHFNVQVFEEYWRKIKHPWRD